jgi:hypothetical protein
MLVHAVTQEASSTIIALYLTRILVSMEFVRCLGHFVSMTGSLFCLYSIACPCNIDNCLLYIVAYENSTHIS